MNKFVKWIILAAMLGTVLLLGTYMYASLASNARAMFLGVVLGVLTLIFVASILLDRGTL